MNRNDLLWVKFLLEKYKYEPDIKPSVKRCRAESSTWRGIRSNWETVQKGLAWNIHNGKLTLFWKDVWVLHYEAHENLVTYVLSEAVLSWSAADCLTPNGAWNQSKFSSFLPSPVMDSIMRLHVNFSDEDDRPMWRWSRNGLFSVKSAYDYLSKHDPSRAMSM